VYNNYNKQDFLAFSQLFNELRNSEHLRPHTLWDIPKRTTSGDIYEGGELSE